MAATSSAYLFNGAILPIHIPGVVKLDSLLALKLAEYGANIKALFHLDGLIVLKKGNDVGFIGYANEGSANLAHHATARHSKIRLSNGVKVIAFNDGGLNVKSHIKINQLLTYFGGRIKLNYTALSAYYFSSSDFGIEYKNNNSATWLIVSLGGNLTQKTTITETISIVTNLSPNELANIRTYITNDEGKFVSETQTVTIGEYVINAFGNYRGTAFSCSTDNQTEVEIWMTQQDCQNLANLTTDAQFTDIYGFSDDELIIPIPNGWYFSIDGSQYKGYQVQNGYFTNYEMCYPPAAEKTFRIEAYQNTNNDGFDIFIIKKQSPNFTEDVTISGRIGDLQNTFFPVYFSITILANSSSGNGEVYININSDGSQSFEFTELYASPGNINGIPIDFDNQGIDSHPY